MKWKLIIIFIISVSTLQANELFDQYFPTRWSVHRDKSSWDYTEYVDDKEFINDNGNMSGFGISYNVPFKNNSWYHQIDIGYMQGTTDYEGSLSNGDDLKGDNFNQIATMGFKFGKIITHFDLITMPTMGLSVRRLTNPKSGDLPGSYDRVAQWSTLDLGFILRKSFFINSYFEFNYVYKYLLSGWVSSELSDVDSDYSDPVLKVDSGFSNQLSFGYFHNIGKFVIGLSLYYEHWLVDESEEKSIDVPASVSPAEKADVSEPENQTFHSGLKLHFMW